MDLTTAKEKLHAWIRDAKSICILGHTGPDGDCAGSTLGVRNYIENMTRDNEVSEAQETGGKTAQEQISDSKKETEPKGKEVQVYLEPFSNKFSYLAGYETVCHEPDKDTVYDLCIVCDCADEKRLGKFAHFLKTAKQSFCVDHHYTNEGFADCSVICPDASSTCEVLYDLMNPKWIDRAVAECIYTGIIHDTGVFRYSSTSPHTMEIAGKCMAFGFPFGEIIDDSFFSMTFLQKQVLGHVLSGISEWLSGRVVYAAIDRKTMDQFGVGNKEMDGFIDQLRTTRGALCAVFLYQAKDGQYKVSLRSNSDQLNVAAVAQAFGGGGHIKAAGCFMGPDADADREQILAEIKKQIGGTDDEPV